MDFVELQRGAAVYYWETVNQSAGCRMIWNAKDGEALDKIWTDLGQKESIETAADRGKALEFRYRSGGSCLICPSDSTYPRQLYDMASPPILCVRGNPEVLSRPQVAIVGSRQTTGNSRQITPVIAEEVISRGIVITSGGAFGIDALAHRHAMTCGCPTVVVSALGTNKVYPRENADIFEYAGHNGAVVSQFPDKPVDHAPNFPQRNDVIAALSFATIIVQCGVKSGALYTANAARKLKRPVYAAAMPGFDEKTAGGLELIRKGHARMLCSADDFDAILPQTQREIPFSPVALPNTAAPQASMPDGLNGTRGRIVSILRTQTGMTRKMLKDALPDADDFDMALLDLELSGIVSSRCGIYHM